MTSRPPSRPHDGQWDCFEGWVNHATRDIGGMNAVCFDAKDRRCEIGKDFMLADREGAFPVRYWHGEGQQSAAEQRRCKKLAKKAIDLNHPWRNPRWTEANGGRW